MEFPKVLISEHSFYPSTLRERGRVLQSHGFEVVSVLSTSEAEFEITMGQCGIFVSCPLLSDFSTGDLFRLFKYYCPINYCQMMYLGGTR